MVAPENVEVSAHEPLGFTPTWREVKMRETYPSATCLAEYGVCNRCLFVQLQESVQGDSSLYKREDIFHDACAVMK